MATHQKSFVIAVTNLKGGVGKSTISTNLAVSLKHRGFEVCILDTDLGQQSAMEWKGERGEDLKNIPVYGITVKQLNKEVEDLKKRFEIIIIDGTPQLSELADRTILASDLVLIPITPSFYDFRGFENFFERFDQFKSVKESNGAKVRGCVILNRIIQNTKVSNDIKEAVKAYNIGIMETQLINRVAYADATSEGRGVIEYSDAKAKQEIENLTSELLTVIQQNAVKPLQQTA